MPERSSRLGHLSFQVYGFDTNCLQIASDKTLTCLHHGKEHFILSLSTIVAKLESKPSPQEMEGIDSLFVNILDYGIELMIICLLLAVLVNYWAIRK